MSDTLHTMNEIFLPTPQNTIVGVVGLGYVGLPVACEFARVGFTVIGIDIKTDRVNKINTGISPIEGNEPGLQELLREVVETGKLQASTNYNDLAQANIVTVNVETPVDDDNIPQYSALKAAVRSMGRVLRPNTLVIIESTVAPGTTLSIVKPLLEESSCLVVPLTQDDQLKHKDKVIFLGMCPERVMPGLLIKNLRGLSRVCGGCTPEIAQTMVHFYRHIIPHADLDPSDILTAELVKTTENAYRDVQIAFANEVALICESAGGDVWKVRELVNKSPGRNMLLPGAGVGGHCIPKDPWLLIHAPRLMGNPFSAQLIPAARSVNEFMPVHIHNRLGVVLAKHGIDHRHARVLMLGYSYLEDSDDTRHTPSEKLLQLLLNNGTSVIIHDPYIAEHNGDVYEKAQNCDAVILMVKHTTYKNLDLRRLRGIMHTPIFIDGRGLYSAIKMKHAQLDYYCVGVNKTI
jgi:UDP-N-acetyl-D-mannosaminuronic acid dehydrogenase